MSCDRNERLIPLFVEGDLPARKAARVHRHLAECVACRATAEAFRASREWLFRHGIDPFGETDGRRN